MNKEKLKGFKIDEILYRNFKAACGLKGVSVKDQLEVLIRKWTEHSLKEIAKDMAEQTLIQNA